MSLFARTIARAALPGASAPLARPKGQIAARMAAPEATDPEKPLDDTAQPLRREAPRLSRAAVQEPEDAPAQPLRRAVEDDPKDPQKPPAKAPEDDLKPLRRALQQEPEQAMALHRAPDQTASDAEDDPAQPMRRAPADAEDDPVQPLRRMATPARRMAPDADHLTADDSIKPDEMPQDPAPALALRREAAAVSTTAPTITAPSQTFDAPPASGLSDWQAAPATDWQSAPDRQSGPDWQPAPARPASAQAQTDRARVVIEEVAVTFHDTPQAATPDLASSLTRALRRRYIGGF